MNTPPLPNHCLRPAFTQALAQQLSAGASLMLTSPHGQGRRRTLRDLRHALPASIRVLQANLRDHPASLAALLASLAEQAGIGKMDHMETLLKALEHQRIPSLIILHNFDELQPDDSSGYDAGFFAALNDMGNHAGLSLLCVCEAAPKLPLSHAILPLPPLTNGEIAAELARRGIAVTEALIEQIASNPAPHSAIEAIAPEASA